MISLWPEASFSDLVHTIAWFSVVWFIDVRSSKTSVSLFICFLIYLYTGSLAGLSVCLYMLLIFLSWTMIVFLLRITTLINVIIQHASFNYFWNRKSLIVYAIFAEIRALMSRVKLNVQCLKALTTIWFPTSISKIFLFLLLPNFELYGPLPMIVSILLLCSQFHQWYTLEKLGSSNYRK